MTSGNMEDFMAFKRNNILLKWLKAKLLKEIYSHLLKACLEDRDFPPKYFIEYLLGELEEGH
jgi:hypothetical protein